MRLGKSLQLLDRGLLQPGGLPVRAASIVVVVLIAVASLTPNISVPSGAPANTDLAIHLFMQGVLGFSLAWGWPKNRAVTVATLAILVVTLEVGQIWVPGRSFAVADLISNAVGAGFGAWFGFSASTRFCPR